MSNLFSVYCLLQKSTTEQTSPKRLKEKNVKVTPKVNHRLSRAKVVVTRLPIDVNGSPPSSHRTRNARVAEFKNTNVMTRTRLSVDRIKSPTQRIEHLKKVAPLVVESNGDNNASSRSSSRKSSITSNLSSPRRQNGLPSPQPENGRRSSRQNSSYSTPMTPTTRRKQVQNGPTKTIENKRVNGLKRDRPAMQRRNGSTSPPLSDEQLHSDTQSPQAKRKASKNIANQSPPTRSRVSSSSRSTTDTNATSKRSASTKSTTSTESEAGTRSKRNNNRSLPLTGESKVSQLDRSLPAARRSLRNRK